jgi:HPt (histidine-containing phosphotransfer) domain-containing protein
MNQDTVFDLDEALARVDHDADIFQTMAELFVEQGPQDLAAAQAALAARDAAAVARSAHRLKGAVLQFCAPSVLELTKRLEELGKAGDLESASDVCDRLETDLVRLCEALRRFASKGASS